mmetsp:Transcript_8521/g.27179  ORF Transcript_8521/g.27179 Transcript_8521/m.27179 type:complete len:349 (-) Transcript_8521:198-1244(-)
MPCHAGQGGQGKAGHSTARTSAADLTSAGALVVGVDLEGDRHALVHRHALVDVRLPEVEAGASPLAGDGVLAPLLRVLLHLLHLGDHGRGHADALSNPDEAPAPLPVVHVDRAREGRVAEHDPVLQPVQGHRDPAGQGHVVGLVAAVPALHDAKLNRELLHGDRLPAAGVHLQTVHAQLLRHRLGEGVAVVHGEPAETPPGVEVLQLSRVTQVLPTDKLLRLGVLLVLDADQGAARHGHVGGLQRPDAGPPVLDLRHAQLDLHALDELREAVLGLDGLPMHVHEVVRRGDARLGHVDEAEAAELLVDLHRALKAGLGVHMEGLGHRLGRLPRPTAAPLAFAALAAGLA